MPFRQISISSDSGTTPAAILILTAMTIPIYAEGSDALCFRTDARTFP